MGSKSKAASRAHNSSGVNTYVLFVLLCLTNLFTFRTHRVAAPPSPPSAARTTRTHGSADLQITSQSQHAAASALVSEMAPSCCRLAYEHSYGLFDDIPDNVWIRFYQEPSQNPQMYRNPQHPDRHSFFFPAYWNFDNLDPWFSCPRLWRLGGLGDGPKYTCDPDRLKRLVNDRELVAKQLSRQAMAPVPSSPYCIVYSFVGGERDTYQWEESLADMVGGKCEIHIFDYQKSQGKDSWQRQQQQKGIQFHPWGLSDAGRRGFGFLASPFQTLRNNKSTHTFLSFKEIQKRLGHEGRKIDIVKIDCNGCEWDTWREWITADIGQLLVKTNNIQTTSPSDMFNSFRSHGWELFSKEIDTRGGKGFSVDWSWIKLSPDFRLNRHRHHRNR